MSEAATTLQLERERIEAERQKLIAETELLLEQRRLLRESDQGRRDAEAPSAALPEAQMRAVADLFIEEHPDVEDFREDIVELEALLKNTAHDRVALYTYLKGLYLLAKHQRGALRAEACEN